MWDDWDDFDDYFKRVQDILNGSFTGGYRKHYTSEPTNYGSAERGVIHASTDLEILDFEDYISITMELHDVREEDLEVKPEENAVAISYMSDGIWRKQPLKLPVKVNPKTAKITYVNHILDIELEKVKEDDRESE